MTMRANSFVFSTRYTLAEVLDMLDADDPPAKVTSISVVPQSENNAHETDCDSDFSDDDVTCDPKRLPSRLLKGDCFMSDGDIQLNLPIIGNGQEPDCSTSVSLSGETINTSATSEENNPQIFQPMLRKTQNTERKLKKNQDRCQKNKTS